jgi:hypothetical protein
MGKVPHGQSARHPELWKKTGEQFKKEGRSRCFERHVLALHAMR